MEDERGGEAQLSVSPGSGGNLTGEAHSGNTGDGSQAEGSYGGGDSGEIMVEVVGSEVLVDGVSGHKEGDIEFVEVRAVEGHVWESREESDGTRNLVEAVGVSMKGDGDKVVESEWKVMESRDEKGSDNAELGDLSSSKTVLTEGGVDCALPSEDVGDSGNNPGNDAMDVPSSDVEFSFVQTTEVRETEAVSVSDEKTNKDEPVDGTAVCLKLECSHVPAKAIVDGEVGKEEAPLVTDSAMSHDHSGTDFGMPHAETGRGSQAASSDVSLNPSHPEDVSVDGINSVEEVGLVNADTRQELLATRIPEDISHGVSTENVSTDSACGLLEVKLTDERKMFMPENQEPLADTDALVSDVQNEKQGRMQQYHGMNSGSDQGIGEDLHANSESIAKESVVEGVECVSIGRVESAAVEYDDLQHSNERDECLKADGDLKTDTVLPNHAFSDELTQPPSGGDTTDVNKDNSFNNVIEADAKENHLNMESLNCHLDNEIVHHGDSDKCESQPVVALPIVEVTDDQKASVMQVKVVDGDGSSEGLEKLDSEISMHSMECPGKIETLLHDSSAENVDLSAKGASPKFVTVDVTVTDDNASINSQSGSDKVVEDSVPCQSKEHQVSGQAIEMPDGIGITPQGISSDAANSDTHISMLPEISEKAKLPISNMNENSVCNLAISSDKLDMPMEADDDSSKTNGLCFMEGENSEAKLMDLAEERDSNRTYHGEVAGIGTGESISESKNLNLPDDKIESVGSLPMKQSGYLLPPQDGSHFSVLDLVWGKVRSHPWWPGQIFDSGDASEKSLKYYKKDAYLVAYFGDQTFAWNHLSELKPFRTHFSQTEKQSSSEAFQNAVNCALQEVSRRIELGLACSCISKDVYSEIESQVVENAGIREESSRRYGVDWSSRAACFEPDKLLDYIRDLGRHASSEADRLDLVLAQAQLSAFCHLKGYRSPTGFPSVGELLEKDVDTDNVGDEMVASLKRKHAPGDDSKSRKERSVTELMGEKEYSPDADDEFLSPGRKRKVLDSLADESDKQLNTNAAKSSLTNEIPKPSFKIGECIRRVASQLTATDSSPRMYEQFERRSLVSSAESFSSNELLSQLQLLAQDQKKGEIYHNNVRNFFLGFRSSRAVHRRGRKKKADSAVGGSGEEFNFDDVNDSYWSDRIVHNYPEEPILNCEDRMGNFHVVPSVEEKSVKPGRKSRKRFSTTTYPMGDNDIDEIAKRKKQETSPAELILNFAEKSCLPSEINLNKMFRRFGPLMESETEVDHDSGCAKVIFKRGSDAEVARNSSEKFNIFGPVPVNYQIGYSPLISVKISPLTIPQCQDDMISLLT